MIIPQVPGPATSSPAGRQSSEPAALRAFLAAAERHEAAPVELSRRLRCALWTVLLLDLACAVVHARLLAPWATGGLADALSLGGHWTLVTVVMLASAAGIAVLAVLTDGFRQANAAHLRTAQTAAATSVVSAGPTLVFSILFVVAMAVLCAVIGVIIFGMITSAFE